MTSDFLAFMLRQLVEDYSPAEILDSLGARYESKSEAVAENEPLRFRDKRQAQYVDLSGRLYKLAHRVKDLP